MPGGLIAPPNQGVGSLIGNRFPSGPEPEQPMGNSGVSILMDLIRKLMEEGDYEGLSKVLPQMYPEDELGAPPGPVLPEPEAPEYADQMEYPGELGLGEAFPEGLLEPGMLPSPAPPSGGNWPQYPLQEGPNTGEYLNPSVADLPGMMAGIGDAGFQGGTLPPDVGQTPGLLPQGEYGPGGFAPPEPLFGPGGFTGAPPDMRQPGPVPELPPELLMLLGLMPQGQM